MICFKTRFKLQSHKEYEVEKNGVRVDYGNVQCRLAFSFFAGSYRAVCLAADLAKDISPTLDPEAIDTKDPSPLFAMLFDRSTLHDGMAPHTKIEGFRIAGLQRLSIAGLFVHDGYKRRCFRKRDGHCVALLIRDSSVAEKNETTYAFYVHSELGPSTP